MFLFARTAHAFNLSNKLGYGFHVAINESEKTTQICLKRCIHCYFIIAICAVKTYRMRITVHSILSVCAYFHPFNTFDNI